MKTRISWKLKEKETGKILEKENGVFFIDQYGIIRQRTCSVDCEGDWIMDDVSNKYDVVDVKINSLSDNVGVNWIEERDKKNND